ncbi:MAG: cupin domain-containing protein [Chloroflexi bacterium]|nr:cupin domain-containing protein [Chloroflexota bacterium]
MVQQRQSLRSERERVNISERFGGIYQKPRIFVKAVESLKYNLNEVRAQHLAETPRVFSPKRRSEVPGETRLIDPGNEPFYSQSLHIHFRSVAPGSRNEGHGHQNEAMFYILEGNGWEEHDGEEHPWAKGDSVAVHNDCVHWHCNASQTDFAESIVYKAKPMWLFLGMAQQGEIGYKPPDLDKRGPRTPWNVGRRAEDLSGHVKVLKPDMTPWEWNQHGHMRKIAGTGVPLRIKATTAFLQDIPAASHSGKRWDMADNFVYFLEGSGYCLHWDVSVEIADQFYARIALEPTRWEWKAGDFMWIPQNMVYQYFNTDPTQPAKFLTGCNTAFEWMGYQSVDLEPCPEWETLQSQRAVGASN